MKKVLIIGFIVFMGCKEQKDSKPKQETLSLINYLKTEYKVDPQIKRLDSTYVKELINENKSLDPDSLINSRIRLYKYKPLNLDFIEYNNRYYYRDRSDSDCYSIYLIRDNNTGKYYQDFIKDDACINYEGICMWSSMQNIISKSDIKSKISDEDIKAYNSINSDKLYEENETHFANKKTGIQLYLNSAFKFSRPSRSQLDSLFYSYDKYFFNRNDSLLSSPIELYSFLRIQAAKLRSEPDYGDLNKSLELLKSQVNLLLLQTNDTTNGNFILWIYKNYSRLRVRRFRIYGNKKSTYSYGIDEYETCF